MVICGAVAAHPGHGIPDEEPSDPGTGGGTDPGGSTGSGSSGSTSSGGSTGSGSSGSTSSSSSSYYHGYDTTSGVTQSNDAGSTETQTSNEAATQQDANAPEEFFDTSESGFSESGPVAMVGLIVLFGLIAMSFPYNEGGTLRNLQIRLFGR